VNQKEAEEILKYTAIIYILKYIAHVECENKGNAGNNRGDWNHFKITQTIPEQYAGKARNQVTTENNHIGHSTQTAGSANVGVQNSYHWE
jgi:hypothetical protein